MSYLVVFLFAVVELLVILFKANGPFFDEGIYITAGIRVLEGHGMADGYLTWFAGSLFWPFLAGIGYKIGGLIGTRILALIFSLVALIFVSEGTKNLFGKGAAFWTTLAFSVSGPFLTLAHLGVYDPPAAAGLAGAFWSLTKMLKSDNRVWLFLASLFFSMAVISKYPSGLMIIPVFLLIWAIRGKKALLDISLFVFFSIVIFLAFLAPFQGEIGQWLGWGLKHQDNFGVERISILIQILYFISAPVLVGFASYSLPEMNKNKLFFLILLGSSFIWPLYHFLLGNMVSMTKHLVFGFIFLYPLVGMVLNYYWSKNKLADAIVFIPLVFLGITQMLQLDRSWVNITPEMSYLSGNVSRGQKLLINDSWPYIMFLYSKGEINSPLDVHDTYSTSEVPSNLCDFDWFVDEKKAPLWSGDIEKKISECGSFQKVYTSEEVIQNFGPDGKFVTYPVSTDIWKNTGKVAT